MLDPNTGAQMQNIESTWWQLKQSPPATQSHHDGGLLFMFGKFLYRQRFHSEEHFFLTSLYYRHLYFIDEI